MRFDELSNDEAILNELGRRLKARRSSMGVSQESLADKALLSRSTVSKIENGHPTKTPEFIRYAQAAGLMDLFEQLLPEEVVSPLAAAKALKKGRRPAATKVTREPGAGPGASPGAKGRIVWPEDLGGEHLDKEKQ